MEERTEDESCSALIVLLVSVGFGSDCLSDRRSISCLFIGRSDIREPAWPTFARNLRVTIIISGVFSPSCLFFFILLVLFFCKLPLIPNQDPRGAEESRNPPRQVADTFHRRPGAIWSLQLNQCACSSWSKDPQRHWGSPHGKIGAGVKPETFLQWGLWRQLKEANANESQKRG